MAKGLVCIDCGFNGKPKILKKGKTAIEVVLYLFLIMPGIGYSAWRFLTRRRLCAICGGTRLVSPDSELGRKLIGI